MFPLKLHHNAHSIKINASQGVKQIFLHHHGLDNFLCVSHVSVRLLMHEITVLWDQRGQLGNKWTELWVNLRSDDLPSSMAMTRQNLARGWCILWACPHNCRVISNHCCAWGLVNGKSLICMKSMETGLYIFHDMAFGITILLDLLSDHPVSWFFPPFCWLHHAGKNH